MIALGFAIEHEGKELLGRVLREKKEIEGQCCYLGQYARKEICAAVLGMGKTRSARSAEILVRNFSPSLFILAGYSGALIPGIRKGEVCGVENFLSEQLRPILIGQGLPLYKTVCSDVIVADPENRTKLAHVSSAQIVDMETEAVYNTVKAHQIPFCSIRVISDEFGEKLPVGAMLSSWDSERGKSRPFALLRYLLVHPEEAVPFFRFVQALPQVRRRLTKTILMLIYDLEI
ncbi:phosphorylase family protein [Candidatus Methylacidiphilum infernorum]|uniref:Nucleoside phosphorylase n=1 Tax=Methylacidiphilum infernorum (isolate V4) TaxID=481448 RepID=B3DYT6_METI4|nr:nucleoside phosphorylase [Candidatus Methylacidiphilum infernorum]ACD82458.1 Nucleoside phosphorylase [Methylacidiphilum infernorum V4]